MDLTRLRDALRAGGAAFLGVPVKVPPGEISIRVGGVGKEGH